MAAATTTKGMMTASGASSISGNPTFTAIWTGSAPKGSLLIRNETTTAEQRVSANSLVYGQVFYTEGAGFAGGDIITFEYSGSCEGLVIRAENNNPDAQFSGNG